MSGWSIRKPQDEAKGASEEQRTRRQSRNSFLAATRPPDPEVPAPPPPVSDEESEEEILLDVSPTRLHASPNATHVSDEEHSAPIPSPGTFLRSVPVDSVYSQASFKRPSLIDVEEDEDSAEAHEGASYGVISSSDDDYAVGLDVDSSERSPSWGPVSHDDTRHAPLRGSASFSLGQRRREPTSTPTSPTHTSPAAKPTRTQQLAVDEDEHHSEGDFRTLRSSADFLALSQGGASQSQSVRSFRTLLAPSNLTTEVAPESVQQARYEKLFLRYFQLVHDRFVEHTLCAYQQATSMRGRLFISDRHLCFHSKFYRRVIPMQEVQYIRKDHSAYIFDDGVTLISRDGKRHVFCGIANRDAFFTRLQALLPNSVTALPATDRQSSMHDMVSIISRQSSTGSLVRSHESNPLLRGEGDASSAASGKDKPHHHQRSLSVSDSSSGASEKPPLTRRLSATLRSSVDIFKEKKTAPASTPTSPPPPKSTDTSLVLNLLAQRTLLDDDLSENFHLPKEERVLEMCHCAMRRNGRYQPGRLYVTQHYLCFRTLEWMAGWAPQLFQTSLESVEDVRTETIAQVFPLALRLRVKTSGESVENHRFAWIPHPARICEALRVAVKKFNEVDPTAGFVAGKPNELFQKHFLDAHLIAADERLLVSSPCVIRDGVVRAGHVFVTENLVCWHVVNAVSKRQEILPYRAVRQVSSGEDGSGTLTLLTSHAHYQLEGLPHVDQILGTISQQRALHAQVTHSAATMTIPLPPPPKEQRLTVGGYQWLASNFFIRANPPSHSKPAEWGECAYYSLPDESHSLSVQLHVPWLTCSLPYYTGTECLRFQAEQLARHSTRSDHMRVIFSERVEKATAFPGSWEGWLAHVTDETQRHTLVLYGRYQDYPPSGELTQDVVITWQQHFPSQSYPVLSTEQLQEHICAVWSSLQPQLQYQYDKNALRYRLESLSCDYNGYKWAHQHPQFVPEELRTWSGTFVLGLLRVLDSLEGHVPAGLPSPAPDTPHPLRFLREVCGYSERQCKNDNDWTARVCYFFSWAGQHHTDGFTWTPFLAAAQQHSECRDVVEYLLHFRRLGKKNTFIGTSLASKMEDATFREGFSFNERFAFLLLQERYFRFFLEDPEMEPLYATLLESMLRNAVTTELYVALCQEMTWYAATERGRNRLAALPGLVPFLYQLLCSPTESIVLEVARALINLLCENDEGKSQLLQCGYFPYCRTRLLSSPYQYSPSTFATLLSLYRACITTNELRLQLTQENALILVSGLLNRRSLFDHDSTFTAVLSVLWRLVNDENRSLLSQGKVLDRVCERLLKESEQVEVLRVSLGTLVALCCGNEYNCIKVSQLGLIPWLAEICSTWEDSLLIYRGLLLLLCVCQFEESRELVMDERLLPVVSCWAQYGTTEEICAIAGQVYVQLYAGQ